LKLSAAIERGEWVYEEFFELNRRPFSAVPCADDFVAGTALQDPLDSLMLCMTQARGIAIVTAPPGAGKTMLCKRAASLLRSEFRSIYLNAAGMETRRALLQSILFELGIEYVGLTEQEARLRLFRTLKQKLHSDSGLDALPERGLILILDEAHLIRPRIFEELRALAEYAPEGTPSVRVVLCGSYELDELLADPSLSAFNQRIGVQICLTPLTQTESAQLIASRLRECGVSDLSTVLTPRALELICLASDGNLRCLTQLTDHSLLLAYGLSRRPADEEIVRLALDDLKELPLRWSEIPPREETPADAPHADWTQGVAQHPDRTPSEWDTDEFPIPDFAQRLDTPDDSLAPGNPSSPGVTAETSLPPFAVYEIGADSEEDHFVISPFAAAEMDSDLGAGCVPLAPYIEPVRIKVSMHETPVIDRYTLLDRYQELPAERRIGFDFSAIPSEPGFEIPDQNDGRFAFDAVTPGFSSAASPADGSVLEEQVLRTIQQLRHDVQGQLELSKLSFEKSHTPRFDIVQPIEAEATIPLSAAESVAAPVATPPAAEGRFAQLFTRLRSRRRRIQSEQSNS